jgi:mRNA interferase HicA
MTGAEFIRLVRRAGRRRGVDVRFVAQRGKGSHGTLYYGGSKSIVKDRKKELGSGLLSEMLGSLGLDLEDLRKGR